LLVCLAGAGSVASAGPIETAEEAAPDLEVDLRLQSRVDDGKWRSDAAVEVRAEQKVELRVRKLDLQEGDHLVWYLVFADLTEEYANASKPWDDPPNKWLGFDSIDYFRMELSELENEVSVEPFSQIPAFWPQVRAYIEGRHASPTGTQLYVEGVGTYFFQVELLRDGVRSRSAGLQDVEKKGLSTKVMRVSRRSDDSYLGHLSAFYNVPSIYGSVLYQSEHHLGVDCADVLMAAYAEWKGEAPKKNYNVAMVAKLFAEQGKAQMSDGVPSETLKWGEDLEPGDLIAVRYDADWATRYSHIGALVGDSDGDGVLSAGDRVVHAGPLPLEETPLSGGAFDGTIVVVRPK